RWSWWNPPPSACRCSSTRVATTNSSTASCARSCCRPRARRRAIRSSCASAPATTTATTSSPASSASTSPITPGRCAAEPRARRPFPGAAQGPSTAAVTGQVQPRGGVMPEFEDPSLACLPALPDAPVALIRLGADGRVLALNRAAVDLLDLPGADPTTLSCDCIWGLAPGNLSGDEGVWVAPGADPARRVCYQLDRDGGGWLLSLPDAESAALWRERAAAPVAAPAPPEDDGQAARLLAMVGDRLAACELDLGLDAGHEDQPGVRRLAAGFGNLAEAIRQAVGLSLQVAAEVPHVVAENDELVRQSQAQVDALETVVASTRQLLAGLEGLRGDLRTVTEVAASADDSAREGAAAARALAGAMAAVQKSSARANDVIEVIDSVAFQTNILSLNA